VSFRVIAAYRIRRTAAINQELPEAPAEILVPTLDAAIEALDFRD
jgi:hypothetical protein